MKTCLLILALIGLQLTARAIENVALSNCVSVVKVSPMKIVKEKHSPLLETWIYFDVSKVGTNRCRGLLELSCYDKNNTVVATLTESFPMAKPGTYQFNFNGGINNDVIPQVDHSVVRVKKILPLLPGEKSLEPGKQY